MANEPFDRGSWQSDPFETVGRFRALDDRDPSEVFQNLRRAFLEQVLLALAFANRPRGAHDVMRKAKVIQDFGMKAAHAKSTHCDDRKTKSQILGNGPPVGLGAR